MKKMNASVLLLLFLFPIFANCANLYQEKALHEKLLTDYNNNIRPAPNFEKALDIYFDFVLEEVQSLDVKEQILDVSAYTTLIWNDLQLAWNTSEFGGIDETVMDPESIWIPDISLYNEAESTDDDTPKYKTKINLQSGGRLRWVSPTNWKSSCSTDISWWPFDNQTCVLKFGSLLYDQRRISLKREPRMKFPEKMRTKYHDVSNGEWTTTGIASYDSTSKFRCCKNEFSTVKIIIKLKRMPLYYLLYVLLPLCALISIFLLIFYLDIGQRSSYGVTILLSISFYLLVTSETLPRRSDNWPLIGITFIIDFFLLSLALPIAEWGAQLAQRSEGPPPTCLMQIMKFFKECIFNCPNCKKKSVTDEVQTYDNEFVPMDDVLQGVTNASCKKIDDNYQEQWRELGKFVDVSFSVVFLILLIATPCIVAAGIQSSE